MRVLFYTSFEVSPQKGGTERITSTIATGLKNLYGVKCYSAFSASNNGRFKPTEFEDKILLRKENEQYQLRKFIIDNDIDIIVNQGGFKEAPIFRKALEGLYKKRLVLCHHFNPGAEVNFFLLRKLIYLLKQKEEPIKNLIKLFLFPCLKLRNLYRLPRSYKKAYECSDVTVLLSDNFRRQFIAFAHIEDDAKFRTIHNALSFDSFFDMSDYASKKKEVLVVSRLDERLKRISLMLKIWNEIEKDGKYDDWRLRIVGHGDMDEPMYHDYVRKHNLKRVSFEGARNPLPYYQRASILLMTSRYEGWGLTLTEAQQCACVPMAFNSYASLTDIITDGENGVIVPNNDLAQYVEKLKSLMTNDAERKLMAANAVTSSHRFEINKIVEEWHNLLFELINTPYHLCINKNYPPQ